MPSLGDLPDLGIEARSPALQADSLLVEPQPKLILMNFFLSSFTLFSFLPLLLLLTFTEENRGSFQVTQLGKNPCVMQETPVRFKDPLEKG